MNYGAEITETCEKRLRKMNKELQRRFATKIRKLAEDPTAHGKPLRGLLHGIWEAYVEQKFRILYTINPAEKKITIEALKHKDEL